MNEEFRNAIGTVESDNNYGALGPVTPRGDRAYGRYQVMGANIPEWTARHLGQSMSPQEFLANPQAQDAVFDRETGSQFNKYGNTNDVTSVWFSGRPMARAGNASDGYNTVPQYIAKVNNVLSRGGAKYAAPDAMSAINKAAGVPDQDIPPTALGFAANGYDTVPQYTNMARPAPAPAAPPKSNGMFDDLINHYNAPQPQAALQPPATTVPAAPKAGMFDDLISQFNTPKPPSPPISTDNSGPVGQQPTQSTPPDAPFSGTRAVTQGATGFNEGFASSVLRPLDVVPYFASKALGGEGVHPFEGTFKEHFVDPMGQPQNRPEQALRGAGNMAGQNLPFLATGAGAAGAGVRSGVTMAEQAAPGIVNKIRGAADSVLEGIAANPVKSAVGENVGASLSGGGGVVGRNVAQDAGGSETQQQLAEMAGQFMTPAGAVAWSKVSPTGLAVKGTKVVAGKVLDNVPEGIIPEQLRPVTGSYSERKADQLAYSNREGKYEDPNVVRPSEGNFATRRMDAAQATREENAKVTAGKELDQIVSSPDAAANRAEAQRLEEAIPGFQPGIAKGTQDPALLKLQQHLESQATGDELRKVQEAYDNNAKVVRKYKDEIVPPVEGLRAAPEQVGPQPATAVPQDRVAAANAARVSADNAALAGQAEGVRKEIKGVSETLPAVDPTETGNLLRSTRKDLKAEADAHMGELRKGVDPEGTAVVALPDENISVNEALNRRAQLNQDLSDYYGQRDRTQADAKAIRALQAQKTTLDDAIKVSSDAGAPGLKEYNDYYSKDYAPRFLEGASHEIGRFARHGYEGQKVASEDVMTRMLGPNSISEARQVNKLYGNDPVVKQKIIDQHLDDFRRKYVDEHGMIKDGAVEKYLKTNERLFNEMPWIRDAIQSKNPGEMYKRLGEAEQRQRAAADTNVAKLVGKNPEQHIDAALKDWQTMRDLKSSVKGDPQAEAALQRAVMDRAPDPMNADKFEAWLKDNDRSLKQVLEPGHVKSLQDALSAARVLNQLPRPTGTVDLPGSLADKTAGKLGITVPSLMQRALSVAQGRMSPQYGVADVATRVARQFSNAETKSAWKEALYNPKVARDLEVMTRKGATPIQLARMRNYLLSVGVSDVKKAEAKK